MAVTLKDIAKTVGVGKSTVSRVLNGTPNPIKISEDTSQKILHIAKKMGYQPNAAARALTTRKTGHIGFILSDNVTDGWENVYFARQFSGVEEVCRKRGYGLNTSMYNLFNIDSFVFPKKVSQKSVDGLILVGYVEGAVVHRFREFEIPCVCIGDNHEVSALVPTISSDVVDGLYKAIQYASKMGHQRIMYDSGPHYRDREVARLLIRLTVENPETSHCKVMLADIPQNTGDYNEAKPLIEYWIGLPETQRPTVVIASDQVLAAFLKEMRKRGLQCPEDISLISSCDTHLCEFADPPLTAIYQDLRRLGRVAVNMLIDHLEKDKPLTPEMSRNDFKCELIIRESCIAAGKVQ